MSRRTALLVVDPQLDFLTGSLPVPGAVRAMDALAAHVAASSYALQIVTCDWHPPRHASFAPQGGAWPVHCVRHTVGAAIWPALADALHAAPCETRVLTKGADPLVEEYSIFKNPDAARAIDALVRENGIESIALAGVAGDVCVLATLQDGAARYGRGFFRVLEEFAPSLDGGAALAAAARSL